MQWHHAGKKILAGALGLTLSGGITAANGAADSHEKYERIWRHATLYQSDQGPMQNFALSGRLQADYAWFDADEGTTTPPGTVASMMAGG